jgi:hypothetical protein
MSAWIAAGRQEHANPIELRSTFYGQIRVVPEESEDMLD